MVLRLYYDRSLYFQKFHSIVLMAVADADNKFLFIDVGGYGSEGDASVLFKSKFRRSIVQNTVDLPEDTHIGIGTEKLPFVFVADDAFPLTNRIIKPYNPPRGGTLDESEKIFNYRLSRARRCVENAFGILTAKFICLSRTLFCSPKRAQKIVAACCVLHNYFIKISRHTYCPPHLVDRYNNEGNLIEGEWRRRGQRLTSVQNRRQYTANANAKQVRDTFKHFVNSNQGSVAWQRQAVFLD